MYMPISIGSKEVELIGELGYESLRGADSYSFTFNNEWLRQHSDLFFVTTE